MSWAHPHLFWLLAAVLALALISWRWSTRVRRARAGVGAGVAHLSTSVARRRSGIRAVLLWGCLVLGIAALAGPRWGASDELHASRGCDLLVMLDCSRSMLAADLYPSRIEAARRKAIDLLRLAPETRMALMPFAAMPVLRCPLTGDHEALSLMLQDCSPDLFPAENGYQGTAIGAAVQSGLTVLGKQSDRGQAILVMSDGADDDHAAVDAAAHAAKAAGIPVYGLFFADPERKVTLVIDGKEEVMDADRSTLDLLAKQSGGICVNAGNDPKDIDLIHEHLVSHVTQLPWEEHRRVVMSERYQWLLLPALACLALGLIMPTRRGVAARPT
jgi:Ca-activated chloride channel family protein